jgi:hypothetical protein
MVDDFVNSTDAERPRPFDGSGPEPQEGHANYFAVLLALSWPGREAQFVAGRCPSPEVVWIRANCGAGVGPGTRPSHLPRAPSSGGSGEPRGLGSLCGADVWIQRVVRSVPSGTRGPGVPGRGFGTRGRGGVPLLCNRGVIRFDGFQSGKRPLLDGRRLSGKTLKSLLRR